MPAAATTVYAKLEETLFSRANVARLSVIVVGAGLGRDDPSFGRVSVFPGRPDAACYGCFLGPRKRRELLETWHSTLRSCSDPGPDASSEAIASSASTPTMAAIVAAMQVEVG